MMAVLRYLADRFPDERIFDPANTSNCITDDLTAAEKRAVSNAARLSLAASSWTQVLW